MHRQWVQILLVVGLMTTFGLGAAAIALALPDPASQTAIASLAGGILFGAIVGVATVFGLSPENGFRPFLGERLKSRKEDE